MTFNKSSSSSYTAGHPSSVEFGSNNCLQVIEKGTVEINIDVEGKQVRCILKNVLHVPDLGYQLLSVPAFDKSGLNTSFHYGRSRITKGTTLLATATMTKNLYQLDVRSPSVQTVLLAQSAEIWHQRLAYTQPSTVMAVRNIHIRMHWIFRTTGIIQNSCMYYEIRT